MGGDATAKNPTAKSVTANASTQGTNVQVTASAYNAIILYRFIPNRKTKTFLLPSNRTPKLSLNMRNRLNK